MSDAWDKFNERYTGPLPARRLHFDQPDGSRVSVSVEKGVTDEQARAEIEASQRRIARGYSYRVDNIDGDQRLNKLGFWLKCRWLDAYWFIKDRLSP